MAENITLARRSYARADIVIWGGICNGFEVEVRYFRRREQVKNCAVAHSTLTRWVAYVRPFDECSSPVLWDSYEDMETALYHIECVLACNGAGKVCARLAD